MEGCTPQHPGYIGQLPPDPQDADFLGLVSKVPFAGGIASAFMALGFGGGAACYEDKTKDYRTPWTKEITFGFFALLAVVAAIVVVLFF